MRDSLGALVPDGGMDRRDVDVGPLSGLTFAVKDLFDIAGVTATCGNPDWARTHAPATRDAPIVEACLAAGAALVGRTVMDELAFSLSGQNPHYGTPTNPNAPGRICGGSSCGSASAVAGGMADFALGTDTGGSIRVPASYCGLHGFRPTHGAVSLEGAMALAPSYDTAGWFARDAEVMQAVADILLPRASDDGDAASASGVAVAADAFALATPRAQEALRPWATRLRRLVGDAGEVELAPPDEGGLAAWMQAFRATQAVEVHDIHGDWVRKTNPAFGPEMRERWDFVTRIAPDAAESAQTLREACAARMHALTAGGRLICLPAAPAAAPELSALRRDWRDHRAGALSLTCPAGMAGLPQLTIPLGRVGGLPLGLGLIGPAGGDRMLLEIAGRLARSMERDPGARFD